MFPVGTFAPRSENTGERKVPEPVIIHMISHTSHNAATLFGMGVQNHKGSGGRESPAKSRGGALVGGLGDEVPQKLKNFKSNYKQILRIFLVVIHTQYMKSKH